MSEEKKRNPAGLTQLAINQLRLDLTNNEISLRDAFTRYFNAIEQWDLYDECKWPKSPNIREQYHLLYQRFGYARRVVNIYPDECWNMVPEIYDDESPEETEFEKAVKELVDKFQLFHYLHRLDRLSRVGRFGLLIIGIAGVSPSTPNEAIVGENPTEAPTPYAGSSTPLFLDPDEINYIQERLERSEELAAKDKKPDTGSSLQKTILYIRPVSEYNAQISSNEMNEQNPRFGKPLMYNVTIGYGSNNESKTMLVHWSNCIHVIDEAEESETTGTPAMEPVLNTLLGLQRIDGAETEALWKGGFPGFSLETAQGYEDVVIDKEAIKEQMELYEKSLKRWLLAEGLNVRPLTPQIIDSSNMVNNKLQHIATSIGVPLRIFLGSEQAQLASSQDKDTWTERVVFRRNNHVTPRIIRPVIDWLIKVGVLPEPKDGKYEVEWPDAAAPTKIDMIDYAQRWANVLTVYLKNGLEKVIPLQMFLNLIVGMSVDEAEEIVEEALNNEKLLFSDEEETLQDENTPPVAEKKEAPDAEAEEKTESESA